MIKRIQKHLISQRHAFRGIWFMVTNEQNFVIELIAASFVVFFGILLRISTLEWFMVGACISSVLTAEAFNTAIEATCDAITRDHHPDIGYAKDVGAAAVLILAIFSVIVGLLIFVPKLGIVL